jgi:hypothetical protein
MPFGEKVIGKINELFGIEICKMRRRDNLGIA